MKIEGAILFPLKVGKSQIHGQGAFATQKIPAKKKIGNLGGIIISKIEGRKKARLKKTVALVELWNGKSLDASGSASALRFINHSCRPNTYMRNRGMQVEFYALRDIDPLEELTCNYGPTHHDGKMACQCGAEGCRGFL